MWKLRVSIPLIGIRENVLLEEEDEMILLSAVEDPNGAIFKITSEPDIVSHFTIANRLKSFAIHPHVCAVKNSP